jgi:hypothetical protein
MKKPIVRKFRCAVYTRKSSEEGLDMEFPSAGRCHQQRKENRRVPSENYIRA